MSPDAGGILASRDDGNHGEHARTGAAAGGGESKGGANPPGGATCLREVMDLQSEWFADSSHRFEAAFERIAGHLAGRKPWSWASLPGLEPHHYDYSGTVACPHRWLRCVRRPEVPR